MPPVPAKKFSAFVLKIQALEKEAYALGLYATAHEINAAKNRAGWEQAERKLGSNIDKAITATKKRKKK
jgi:hypothetical protein